MSLPTGQLARSSFDFNGTAIPIRSLSRKEALGIRALEGDIEAAEVHILMCGTDSTAEEVEQFRTTQPAPFVDGLVEAIARLSGIYSDSNGNGSSPKA